MDQYFADDKKPSAARMYDYYLGGVHNFAVDREAAEQIMRLFPDARLGARSNRYFLNRAVRFMTMQGVDQFLDIGSGIPTAGNVHQIANEIFPFARVVYVDIDMVAVEAGLRIIGENSYVTCTPGDLRNPASILQNSDVRRNLDFTRPIGLMLVAVLHFVLNDNQALRSLQKLYEALPSGSYVAISHGTDEFTPEFLAEEGLQIYKQSTTPAKLRPLSQFERFFDGLELVEPGIVLAPLWRPDDSDGRDRLRHEPERSGIYAGVARKP